MPNCIRNSMTSCVPRVFSKLAWIFVRRFSAMPRIDNKRSGVSAMTLRELSPKASKIRLPMMGLIPLMTPLLRYVRISSAPVGSGTAYCTATNCRPYLECTIQLPKKRSFWCSGASQIAPQIVTGSSPVVVAEATAQPFCGLEKKRFLIRAVKVSDFWMSVVLCMSSSAGVVLNGFISCFCLSDREKRHIGALNVFKCFYKYCRFLPIFSRYYLLFFAVCVLCCPWSKFYCLRTD